MIRPATPADYAALARIVTETNPEYPLSPEQIAHEDTSRDPKCRMERWAVEENGEIVGFGQYNQWANMYHPQRFIVDAAVTPSHQGQGYGRALYEHILQALAPLNPLSIRAHTREDMSRSVRFLHDRGFAEDMRSFESWLDVAAFDPAPWADAAARVSTQGIEFKSLAQMERTPGHLQKHYELTQELDADVPSPEPHTRIEKDLWRQRAFSNPGLLRDGFFFAVLDGQYLGVTMLFSSPDETGLYTGLTGVKREYRRRGIALALKLHAISWAKQNGYPQIKTWNESRNAGMLGINIALGFVRQPAWLDLVKTLGEE